MTHPNRTPQDVMLERASNILINLITACYDYDQTKESIDDAISKASHDIIMMVVEDRKAQATAMLEKLPREKDMPLHVDYQKEAIAFNEALDQVRSIIKEHIEGLDGGN